MSNNCNFCSFSKSIRYVSINEVIIFLSYSFSILYWKCLFKLLGYII